MKSIFLTLITPSTLITLSTKKRAERAGIEPATAGLIRLLLVLKTSWDTSPVPSKCVIRNYQSHLVLTISETHFTKHYHILYKYTFL